MKSMKKFEKWLQEVILELLPSVRFAKIQELVMAKHYFAIIATQVGPIAMLESIVNQAMLEPIVIQVLVT